MTYRIRPMTADEAAAYRAVRLAALRDAPYAFASTFELESAWTDAEWTAKIRQRHNDVRSRVLLAFADDDASPCGVACSLLDPEVAGRCWLTSLWVAPAARRGGVARRLIAAGEAFARAAGGEEIWLEVSETNRPAIALYERLGYVVASEPKPFPSDPSVMEFAMKRRL